MEEMIDVKNFKCRACGNCCVHGVLVDLEEAKKIIALYGGQMHELTQDKDFPSGWRVSTSHGDTVCLYRKKNLCSIHENKPFYCKEFPLEDGKISPSIDYCDQLRKSDSSDT